MKFEVFEITLGYTPVIFATAEDAAAAAAALSKGLMATAGIFNMVYRPVETSFRRATLDLKFKKGQRKLRRPGLTPKALIEQGSTRMEGGAE